jgi:hypothetical protein
MLLSLALTGDSEAVLSMLDDYGGAWVDLSTDASTPTRPRSWDDVSRAPAGESVRGAVLRAELHVIPAQEAIYSSLRRGELEGWARPNGSGNIVKIEPIQWAGLRFRSLDGHDIAFPVDSEGNWLPLPRPLADYLSCSVPATETPTVWPDPMFSPEQALQALERWRSGPAVPLSCAPPPATPHPLNHAPANWELEPLHKELRREPSPKSYEAIEAEYADPQKAEAAAEPAASSLLPPAASETGDAYNKAERAGKKPPIPDSKLKTYMEVIKSKGGPIPAADSLLDEVIAAFPKYRVTRDVVRKTRTEVWGWQPPGRRRKDPAS